MQSTNPYTHTYTQPSHFRENHILTMEDVMGFEPDITTGAVGAIMREMDDKFVGLAKVKESFVVMISNLKKAYYEDCLG